MGDYILKREFEAKGLRPQNREQRPLTIITREEWGAVPPTGAVPTFQYKPNIITFTFNTRSGQCHTKEECIKVVQGIQQTDMADGQPDIDYNFLVGGDGNVYEGRGWLKRASFTRKDPPTEHPQQTFDVGMIGDYTERGWPHVMLLTQHQLIEHGVKEKYIQSAYFFAKKWDHELVDNALDLVKFGVQKKFIKASYTFSN